MSTKIEQPLPFLAMPGPTGTLSNIFDYVRDGGVGSMQVIIGMVIAGFNTTSVVALWAIYLLANNPSSQEKLHQELTSVLGDSREISTETINRLPYLKALIKECMGLRPAIHFNFRQLHYDFEVLGYTVPSQVGMLLNTLVLSTSEKHYGSNAKAFLPERWLRHEKSATKSMHEPFTYLPFGYGVRMCVGRQLALAGLYSLCSQLMLNFQMEYMGKDEPKQKFLAVAVRPDIHVLVNTEINI